MATETITIDTDRWAVEQNQQEARDWEMKAQGIESVIPYVVSKPDQYLLRQLAADKRAEGKRALKEFAAPRPVPMGELVKSVEDALIRGLGVHRIAPEEFFEQKPIPTEEHLPTEADADPFYMVAVYNNLDDRWEFWHWAGTWRLNLLRHTFWQPTNLKRPPAPGEEG